MSYSPPPRARSGPRRRTLLASLAGATALLTGCSAGSGPAERAASAATRARARAARDSADLLARYDAVLDAHPALADRLSPLRAAVAAHRDAFGGTPDDKADKVRKGAKAGKSPSPAPTASADRKEALTSLASAERTVADRRAAALLEVPGELARLMASVSAAGSAHAYLLTEAAK
ncbi:hypothetical protein E5082_05225 [Streptomyces griseoluteus]|uniref:Lipoprotein n=1 Tax=Streptomyces griseoluteus TaxID=29306 RepID=A0A4Z1DQN4_STRGP|nr:hypothetical protein [Streptomyces griseoluteus]TGN87785.1 hypothetical protein E5082_05225 [Streptomyces griseoluteus]GHF24188.1 lipoprotein [Streptomyces griseoluteus]